MAAVTFFLVLNISKLLRMICHGLSVALTAVRSPADDRMGEIAEFF